METTLRARIDALGDGLHRLRLADGRAVVVKRRRRAPPGFFAMEAHGLALLREARALRVAEVVAMADDALVLVDLGRGHPGRGAWEQAGAALARQHARTGEQFGLARDGWCGDGVQPNTSMDDGWRFFAECRLLPQALRACEAGRLAAGDVARIEQLCVTLPARIPAQPPSLLHGDLWLGNLHVCADGELALIDAGAAHYGWAEAELAMLTLFGEPPGVFFEAYRSAAGSDDGWRERAPIYNLYHLLNHLNLFGPGYLGAVQRVLVTQ